MRLRFWHKVTPHVVSHDEALAALHDIEHDNEKLATYDSNPNWLETKFQSVPLGAPLNDPPPFV